MPIFSPGPQRRRPGSVVSGGQLLALPQATTLPATQVQNTSVYLNGSINPEGTATSYWFVYGTTAQYGSSTVSLSAGSGSLPVTVGTALTSLVVNTTYHYAAVASSSSGTVYGADQTFVTVAPSVVTAAGTPLSPYGTPVPQPHLQWVNSPLTITTTGAVVCEQDSLADVFSCVQMVGVCPQNAVPEIPGFGVPDLSFGLAPLDPQPIVAAIKRWEPRATEGVVSQALGDPDAGIWQFGLTSMVAGTDGVAS